MEGAKLSMPRHPGLGNGSSGPMGRTLGYALPTYASVLDSEFSLGGNPLLPSLLYPKMMIPSPLNSSVRVYITINEDVQDGVHEVQCTRSNDR